MGDFLGGLGGYSKGEISMQQGKVIYAYVGGEGNRGIGTSNYGGFNGGGIGNGDSKLGLWGGGGGGGSDFRILGDTLLHRVIVAGGGGGAGSDTNSRGGKGRKWRRYKW